MKLAMKRKVKVYHHRWWWIHLEGNDLNHVCRACIEQTGTYVRWQAEQTHYPPHGDLSDIYNVYTSYIYIKLKLFRTQIMGKYLQLTGTVTGSFRQVWIREEKSYSFSCMLSLFKFNWTLSVCMPNNLGFWQDRITWSFLFYQSLIMIWPIIYQFYNIAFMYQAFVIIDHNSKRQKQPNNLND